MPKQNVLETQFKDVFSKTFNLEACKQFIERLNKSLSKNTPFKDIQALSNIFEDLLDPVQRKANSAVYTPHDIAISMCNEALIHYLLTNINIPAQAIQELIIEKKINNELLTHAQVLDEILREIKIIDLAVGLGAFYFSMLEVLTTTRHTLTPYVNTQRTLYELQEHAIQHSLFAYDIDTISVNCMKLLVCLILHQEPMQWNISRKDSVVEDIPLLFDIVIGNPPYLGEEGHKEIFMNIKTTAFGKKYYTGKMDMWYFFMSKGITLLKDNGILSYIIPNNWMTTTGAKKMRAHIATATTLLHIRNFDNVMIFDKISQQTMIMTLKKSPPPSLYTFHYQSLEQQDNIEYDACLNKDGRPVYFLTTSIKLILDKISSGNKVFLDKHEITNGIHPHHAFVNNKMLALLPKEAKVGDGIFILSKKELLSLNLTPHEMSLIKPYYDTANIGRYSFDDNNNYYIIYTTSNFKHPDAMDSYPHLKQHLDYYQSVITSDNRPYGLHRARQQRFFEQPKIVSLRKCITPTFAYISRPSYVTAEWYCIQTDKINMKYLTCLLNSSLIKFWLWHKGKRQGNIFQVDKEPLLHIPIAVPNETIIQQIAQLHDNHINESEIDHIIFDIYNINEQEQQTISTLH